MSCTVPVCGHCMPGVIVQQLSFEKPVSETPCCADTPVSQTPGPNGPNSVKNPRQNVLRWDVDTQQFVVHQRLPGIGHLGASFGEFKNHTVGGSMRCCTRMSCHVTTVACSLHLMPSTVLQPVCHSPPGYIPFLLFLFRKVSSTLWWQSSVR